jgi:glycosyltransferase involved in cell wall biosynthesis
MNKLNITAIILTHNEKQHIARCISSVEHFVTDVVVVDSFSNDGTVEIAERLGARVFRNAWVNYSAQFQWALDNTKIDTEWVMRIDADEYAEPSLVNALSRNMPQLKDETTGLYVRRKYLFLGTWIRHGAMYPVYVLRIWRHGVGRIEQRWMDEHIVLRSGQTMTLDGDLTDDNKNSVAWWINKHNQYATREMIDLLNIKYRFLPQDNQLRQVAGNSQAKRKRAIKEHIYTRMPLFIRPICYFLYRYFFRLGFLDGSKGFAFHFMQGLWYRALVDLKTMEAEEWIKACKNQHEIRATLAEKTGLAL